MFGWLWEYYVTPAGFEIRLFRFLLIYRLAKQSIVSVRIVTGLGNLDFGSHPWNTVSLGNRPRLKWVLVEKKCWPRFLGITPNNPEQFIEALDLPNVPLR